MRRRGLLSAAVLALPLGSAWAGAQREEDLSDAVRSALSADVAAAEDEHDLDEIRPDLALVLERRALTLDAARPDAVAARHATGRAQPRARRCGTSAGRGAAPRASRRAACRAERSSRPA